jgi:hypothetical protein
MRTKLRTRLKKEEYGTIKKMDDNTYSQRRKVMDYVYEAKNLLRSNGVALPRITVRITDAGCCQSNYAGVAGLNTKEIYIPTRTLNKWYLRQVVFHEIVHAVTGFMHDDKCPLMHPIVQENISKEEIDKTFISYFK